MGVVVIDGILAKAIGREGSSVKFIAAHGEAGGVAGGNAAFPKEHDCGGGKGGAVALPAFREEIGDKVFAHRRFPGICGIGIIFRQEIPDFFDPLPLFG